MNHNNLNSSFKGLMVSSGISYARITQKYMKARHSYMLEMVSDFLSCAAFRNVTARAGSASYSLFPYFLAAPRGDSDWPVPSSSVSPWWWNRPETWILRTLAIIRQHMTCDLYCGPLSKESKGIVSQMVCFKSKNENCSNLTVVSELACWGLLLSCYAIQKNV